MADEQDTKGKGKGKAVAVTDAPEQQEETQTADPQQVQDILKALNLTQRLPGAVSGDSLTDSIRIDREKIVSGKKQKDMDSYQFWGSQPVPNFEEAKVKIDPDQEGQIKEVLEIRKSPIHLPTGFEWCTMDLSNEEEVKEVYNLLSQHYVEDDSAMFRFRYSESFLNWALKSPGWKKEWHVGVRATKSRTLVATIFGVPIDLRVRDATFRSAEVNYLCVHKKMRGKKMTPVLITEITRRFNVEGIYQAIYTAGVVLPAPVSTCRYYHRALDFEKLHETGFSQLPRGTTVQRQALRFRLPPATAVAGVRPMEEKDIDQVSALLAKYLARFDTNQVFSKEEIRHWALQSPGAEQVVWSYVVEKEGKITDFFSFYVLESTIIRQSTHDHKTIRAAYLYYYATDVAFEGDLGKLKKRLNELIKDALVLAKRNKFDVFNALTLMDNPLFLEEQKFGRGDGLLHYYLFNYRTSPIAGGTESSNESGGVGIVML